MLLPIVLSIENTEFHEDLDNYVLNKIVQEIELPEDFMLFGGTVFPAMRKCNIIPLSQLSIVSSLIRILSKEIESVNKFKQKITAEVKLITFAKFVTSLLDEAMNNSIAHENLPNEFQCDGIPITYNDLYLTLVNPLKELTQPIDLN